MTRQTSTMSPFACRRLWHSVTKIASVQRAKVSFGSSVQFRTMGRCRQSFLEYALATGDAESIQLELRILIERGFSGVADEHARLFI